MKVLVINCGSSSLKYQLIDSETESVLAKGLCERIGIDGRLTHKPTGKDKVEIEVDMPSHTVAVSLVLKYLTDEVSGVIASLDEIGAVGHRVVHGGERFVDSVVINDEVIDGIAACNDLAPLHNPANIIGINACKELMPSTPMVAVFDTAFHQTMPKEAYLYATPIEYYEKYSVRRYGFHGTSHEYVSARAAEMCGKDIKDMKIVVCHLGNGASCCAVDGGKSIDTSMGLTPLAGLIMGTRAGDIDVSACEYIANKEGMDMAAMMNMLNKKSGVLGLSGGISSDFRDIEAAMDQGNQTAIDAIDAFCYRVIKYIGAYVAAMNGVDAIAFTAGVGENDGFVREKIVNRISYLGIELDKEANSKRGEDMVISTADSKVKVLVIPTDEELMICRKTAALV